LTSPADSLDNQVDDTFVGTGITSARAVLATILPEESAEARQMLRTLMKTRSRRAITTTTFSPG
jgi:hypothetical protein